MTTSIDRTTEQMNTNEKLRFWAKVNKGASCWEWDAARDAGRYGRFWLNGRMESAHRVAYQFSVGPIPSGLEIDHLCRNKRCVNPSHLEAVTHQENMARYAPFSPSKNQTTCIRGHQLGLGNLRRREKGRRRCAKCQNEVERRYKQRTDGYNGYGKPLYDVRRISDTCTCLWCFDCGSSITNETLLPDIKHDHQCGDPVRSFSEPPVIDAAHDVLCKEHGGE